MVCPTCYPLSKLQVCLQVLCSSNHNGTNYQGQQCLMEKQFTLRSEIKLVKTREVTNVWFIMLYHAMFPVYMCVCGRPGLSDHTGARVIDGCELPSVNTRI